MRLKLALCALAAVLTATPASAQKLWLGVTAGMAASSTETSIDHAVFGNILGVDGFGATGPMIGGAAGFDMQIQQFRIGLMGDYIVHNDHDVTISSGLLPGTLATFGIDSQWTVAGRAGLVMDKAYVYGLLGWTSVAMNDLSVPAAALTFQLSDMQGWTYGGGLEYEIAPNIALAAEYRYAKLDAATIPLAPGLSTTIQPVMHSALARLSYKFDFLK